jgi:hypothetical protein
MKLIGVVALTTIYQLGFGALAGEHGRIKKKPPTPVEAERIASDMVMNDGSLRKGDIVSTDRGFFLYRGLRPDGYTNDFVRVPNPVPSRHP